MSNRNRARKRRGVAPVAVAAPPAAARQAKQARHAPEPRRAAEPRPAAGFDRLSLLGAGGVALIAFVVYALTVEPSVPTGDSGELIAAAYVLGVAHPPGYPLYMLVGHLATLLPGGSPALRMNLLSGLCDSLAIGVVFLVAYRLAAFRVDGAAVSPRRWTPIVAGAVGALLLAFSSLFWAYSVVAEVFALNNLFAALLLLIGLEWCRRPERTRLLWLFMFLLGLALCNQQTIVLLIPAFVVLAWQGWRLLPRGGLRLSTRQIGLAALAFVAGLLPYLYLPLAASSNPVMNWGDPSTLQRFYTDVSRGNYGTTTLVVGGKSGSIWENLRLLGSSLAHGFVYAGVALAAAGLWWAWRNRRSEGIALFVAFLVAGPLFQAYTNTSYPDELTKGIIARFYILPSVPLAILSGLGAWWVLLAAERVREPSRRGVVCILAAGALLVVPVAAAADHYSSIDQSGNRVALDYGRDVLGPLAPNALLLMRSDENYTSVSYAQFVDNLRPDVIALDSELLKLPTYVAQIRREHPTVLIPFASYDGGVHTSLNKLVSANLPTRPVYVIGGQEETRFGMPFDEVDAGLVTRMLPKGSSPGKYSLLLADPTRWTHLHYPAKSYPQTSWEGSAIEYAYGNAAFDLGFALDTGGKGDRAVAERMYRTAIRLAPTLSASYKDLGLDLYNDGGHTAEVSSLWTTFLRLDPTDPQAAEIESALGRLKAKQGGS